MANLPEARPDLMGGLREFSFQKVLDKGHTKIPVKVLIMDMTLYNNVKS